MAARSVLTTLLLISSAAPEAVPLARAGNVTVLARGPGGLRIEGKSTEVSLAEEASVLLFKVPLAPIDTGIGLRNRHLREALEVEKFPDAMLLVRRADVEFPKERSPVESHVTGELMLHGHSRPVPVHYRAERREAGLTRIAGSLQLDIPESQIGPPPHLAPPPS